MLLGAAENLHQECMLLEAKCQHTNLDGVSLRAELKHLRRAYEERRLEGREQVRNDDRNSSR